MASLFDNNVSHILMKSTTWTTWYSHDRQQFINTIPLTNLFNRRFRWWLAASVGVISLSISLSISIPGISVARRERSQQFCKALDGNRDMYGIGIRIATYLQGVMTIFGEVYTAEPKYAAALTSVNLWYLWALLSTWGFCKEPEHISWRDIDMLRALGDTISYINLGALLLPAKKLELESVFTRIMRWVTMLVWQLGSPHLGISQPRPLIVECDHDWFFFIYNSAAAGRHPRMLFNSLFIWGTILVAIPIVTMRMLVYASQFPLGKAEEALNCCKDTLGENKNSRLVLWVDILYIYPVGDVMALLDTPGELQGQVVRLSHGALFVTTQCISTDIDAARALIVITAHMDSGKCTSWHQKPDRRFASKDYMEHCISFIQHSNT